MGLYYSDSLLNEIDAYMDVNLPPGIDARTIGPHMVFNRGEWRPDTAAGMALIAHELMHSRDARALGLGTFVMRYGTELLRNLWNGMTMRDSYLHVSFERDAYEFQAEVFNDMTGIFPETEFALNRVSALCQDNFRDRE